MKFIDSLHRASAITVCVFAGALASLSPTLARAAAPLVWTQAPGFYRMALGDFEITALSDGTFDEPVDELLAHTTRDRVNEALAKSFLHAPVETSFNAYLVNTGEKLILIDTGAGGLFGPSLGKLAANLQAAGYRPEQVDEIYITHVHPDHVGGLMAGDKMVFPNALVRMGRKDLDYWLNPANAATAPESVRGFFPGAVASLKPYAAAGRLKAIEDNGELAPGISAVSTIGHTPGHTSFLVESKGQKLMVWGDLVHVAAVQYDAPSVTTLYDSDMNQAEKSRRKAFADAAQQGWLVTGAHLAFPGIGHVRTAGKGFAWVPVNYSVPSKP